MGRQSEYPHYSEYVKITPLPWLDIFADIRSAGCSDNHLARLLGVSLSSLQRWQNGTEPKHSVANAIMVIHVRLCGEQLTSERIAQAK